MPIYVFKCPECGEVVDQFVRNYHPPKIVTHPCPTHDQEPVSMRRHMAGEVPKTHPDGGYRFTPHYDSGAGRHFDSHKSYKEWQASRTGDDGVAPEPMSGRRRVSFYEEAAQANHINKSFQIDESAERRAIGKAYDEAHRELADCAAMGIKPPSLDE